MRATLAVHGKREFDSAPERDAINLRLGEGTRARGL